MRVFDPIPPRLNKVAVKVIKCAKQVHEQLGPGLLEAAYQGCMALEMRNGGLTFERNRLVPVLYGNVPIEGAMQLDFLVEEMVIVTVKAVDALRPLHEAQLRTCLKFSEKRLGLLLNFDVVSMKQGIKRVAL